VLFVWELSQKMELNVVQFWVMNFHDFTKIEIFNVTAYESTNT
jgi:hypothetical protein